MKILVQMGLLYVFSISFLQAQEVKFTHTDVVFNEYGIPKTTVYVAVDTVKLKVADTYNMMEIDASKHSQWGIPATATHAFKSYHAGSGKVYYALEDTTGIGIYQRDISEGVGKTDFVLHQFFPREEFEVTMTTDKYRDMNWNPQAGRYYFSEEWTFTYRNEFYQEDDQRGAGEVRIYLDRKSGTVLLLSGESYSDEMTRWIIIEPSGSYISKWTREHGKDTIVRVAADEYFLKYRDQHNADVTSNFISAFKPVGKQKVFGKDGRYCIDDIEASEYAQNNILYDGKSTTYIADVPFDLSVLYMIDQSEARPEGGLHFPILAYGANMPPNYMVVADITKSGDKTMSFQLECIGATEYHIDINE